PSLTVSREDGLRCSAGGCRPRLTLGDEHPAASLRLLVRVVQLPGDRVTAVALPLLHPCGPGRHRLAALNDLVGQVPQVPVDLTALSTRGLGEQTADWVLDRRWDDLLHGVEAGLGRSLP